MSRSTLGVLPLAIAACLLVACSFARAETFHDDFSGGVNPATWAIVRSADLPHYTVDGTHGEARLAKPVDATHSGEQWIRLDFRYPVLGDFAAEVQYHLAFLTRVHGFPGNSIQFVARLPGVDAAVVRAEELSAPVSSTYGRLDPPGFTYGRIVSTVTAGTLRITRVGAIVTLRSDGVPVFTGFMPGDTLRALSLMLANTGTTDSTSVTFDDFDLVADDILFEEPTLDVNAPVLQLSLGVAPNPARERLAFALELPQSGAVRLELLDLQGRVAAHVHDGVLGAGRHTIEWPAARGALRPGVYLAVAEWHGRRITRRVTLTR